MYNQLIKVQLSQALQSLIYCLFLVIYQPLDMIYLTIRYQPYSVAQVQFSCPLDHTHKAALLGPPSVGPIIMLIRTATALEQHHSNESLLILNESLCLVINFIIIQPSATGDENSSVKANQPGSIIVQRLVETFTLLGLYSHRSNWEHISLGCSPTSFKDCFYPFIYTDSLSKNVFQLIPEKIRVFHSF